MAVQDKVETRFKLYFKSQVPTRDIVPLLLYCKMFENSFSSGKHLLSGWNVPTPRVSLEVPNKTLFLCLLPKVN